MCSQARLPGKRHVHCYYKPVPPDSIQGHLLHAATFKSSYHHVSNPIRDPPSWDVQPSLLSYSFSKDQSRLGGTGTQSSMSAFSTHLFLSSAAQCPSLWCPPGGRRCCQVHTQRRSQQGWTFADHCTNRSAELAPCLAALRVCTRGFTPV